MKVSAVDASHVYLYYLFIYLLYLGTNRKSSMQIYCKKLTYHKISQTYTVLQPIVI